MTRKDSDSLIRKLEQLVSVPREDLSCEIKSWLDLDDKEHGADLAHALLALANHGGGYVLLGFTEECGKVVSASGRPDNLKQYDRDRINGIVQKYADPAFHCEVYHVKRVDDGQLHPVVVVPGGHALPIRAKRSGPGERHVRQNTYYTRLPGPKSAPPESGSQWDEFIRRCVRHSREGLLSEFRTILEGQISRSVPEAPAERLGKWMMDSDSRWESMLEKQPDMKGSYEHGTWRAAYLLEGDFDPPPLPKFLKTLEATMGSETGWPVWLVRDDPPEMRPHTAESNTIECWLKQAGISTFSDYWRASPDGRMFLLRGIEEDDPFHRMLAGTIITVQLPIWRMGECLLHAQRLAEALGAPDADVVFRMRYDGLSGRKLGSTDQWDCFIPEWFPCRQGSVEAEVVTKASEIGNTLVELVTKVTAPLFAAFNFYEPSPGLIARQIGKLRGRK